mmetsp:Transcript_41387/g.134234  ORF Transcript_41387/g.134234 Transcript_41387/m.134234 type:complete len:204 (-) Transcript_41387:435-1046(-)
MILWDTTIISVLQSDAVHLSLSLSKLTYLFATSFAEVVSGGGSILAAASFQLKEKPQRQVMWSHPAQRQMTTIQEGQRRAWSAQNKRNPRSVSSTSRCVCIARQLDSYASHAAAEPNCRSAALPRRRSQPAHGQRTYALPARSSASTKALAQGVQTLCPQSARFVRLVIGQSSRQTGHSLVSCANSSLARLVRTRAARRSVES